MSKQRNQSGKPTRRTEAAEASKRAILDAAEALFAQQGYEATSLQEISDRAGVTRGLPTYFFGSKEDLYRAVLERTFALTMTHELLKLLRKQGQHQGARPEDGLRIVIERLFDFLVTHPTFIRITEWEALSGGRYLGNLPRLVTTLHEAVQVLREEVGWHDDAEQFLIDLVALCWFPLAQAVTFLQPLGVDIADPAFLARRKQHVAQLLLDGARARDDVDDSARDDNSGNKARPTPRSARP
ncbi:MAG TPA: TetR/AcrR family transcriptional regulator [Ktedonobacterales bacterium]|nr:TetR/AcrR family transcriptional regulator [Ktedonobacterales bacterium]